MTVNPIHHLKDPAKLTPYEEKLVELKNKGLTYQEMAAALEGKSSRSSIASRYKIIKEKLELLEHARSGK